tara:strand:+ start:85 stop:261 length:177 start_codon:yes stop_codon:yes gene_type:complete
LRKKLSQYKREKYLNEIGYKLVDGMFARLVIGAVSLDVSKTLNDLELKQSNDAVGQAP